MGPTGAGTHEAQDCIDGVDVYFGTFAKSMAGIGAFVASTEEMTNFLGITCVLRPSLRPCQCQWLLAC